MASSFQFVIDESGDLGWTFDHPYRSGGSSRFMTIAALIVPSSRKDTPKRIIRRMHDAYGWPATTEKKASEFAPQQCEDFAKRLAALLVREPTIKIKAMTVKKEKVKAHIRSDGNKLYNYMTNLLICDELAATDEAFLMPDERSVKVESGNSLVDYLTIEQWFVRKTNVNIIFKPQLSHNNLSVRVADALAHIIFSHYEDGDDHGYSILKAAGLTDKTLFF